METSQNSPLDGDCESIRSLPYTRWRAWFSALCLLCGKWVQ